MKTVVLTTEQVRYRTPGGIGTYIRGLQLGFSAVHESEFNLKYRNGHGSLRATSWCWDHKLLPVNNGDLIHSTSFRIPPTSKPLAVTVHDLLWRKFPETFPERAKNWHERQLDRALNKAISFVVPSEQSRIELVEAGASNELVHIIPHGTDHLPLPDLHAARDLLTQRNINGPFLLTVGTQEPRKNLNRIVGAVKQANSSLAEPVHLLIAGPHGWMSDELIGEHISTVEQVPQSVLAGLFALARLFIYAPLAEGYGLPAVEAMHAGLPVIASAIPSVNNSSARIVDPTSEDEIAKAVYELWSDENASKQLAERGKEFVAAKTWANATSQHLDFWRSILS